MTVSTDTVGGDVLDIHEDPHDVDLNAAPYPMFMEIPPRTLIFEDPPIHNTGAPHRTRRDPLPRPRAGSRDQRRRAEPDVDRPRPGVHACCAAM